MDIGQAVLAMRDQFRVTRKGWNGKDMYLQLQIPDSHSKMTLPYVYMRTVQGDLVPWLCSQTDLLANDWEIASHLPPHLQEVSKPFGELAQWIAENIPSNPERTVGLRKLLEAKDCVVRAKLYKDPLRTAD